jgi:tetratricopeptide (TPR) repeat protein
MHHFKIFFLCIVLSFVGSLSAQQQENNKILRGKVLFQNSNYMPAVGVSVSGVIYVNKEKYVSNKVYTDSKGQYELSFPLARIGHSVKLTIGETDNTGQELEVVNEKEISFCRIPVYANQEFKIIVCPKGSQDLAARKYYKILKNSAELAYEKLQEEFRTLIQTQNKDYKTIQEVVDNLTKLHQLSDSIAIYKEAMAIASINKDGVNERVLNYLKLLDEGKSIQEAREALSISKALNDMDKGITLFRFGAIQLEERARASATLFDYKDAVVCYDTLIAKAENLYIDQLELSEYYLSAAGYNIDGGYYQKALVYSQKLVVIREKLLDSLDANLADSYSTLTLVYQKLGLL